MVKANIPIYYVFSPQNRKMPIILDLADYEMPKIYSKMSPQSVTNAELLPGA